MNDKNLDLKVLEKLKAQKVQEIVGKIDRKPVTTQDLMMLDLLNSMISLLQKSKSSHRIGQKDLLKEWIDL